MEEDICVNEYIRTKDGKIDKLHCEINKNSWRSMDNFGRIIAKCQMDTYLLKDIVKHSKNIIDLIEVGDFVNGYKVIDVIIDPAPSGKCVDIDSSKDSSECTLWEEDIKTILTHEQYKRNCYRLEG